MKINTVKPNYQSRSEKKEWERRLEVVRAIRSKFIQMSPLPIAESSLLVGILKEVADLRRILEYLKQEKCYKKFTKEGTTYLFYEVNPKILDRVFYHIDEQNKIYVGQILKCSGLVFDARNGDATYGNKSANFKPGDDEYKLLKALLEKPNEGLSSEEIIGVLDENKNSTTSSSNIGFIIRNIKNKLGMSTKSKKGNKNLFEPRKGYRMICD